MYNIVIDYAYSRIEPRLPENINVELYNELKYKIDGIEHSWAYKHKKTDGYARLYNIRDQSFRTGLFWRTIRKLSKLGIEYKTVDLRVNKSKLSHLANFDLDVKPFSFQVEAIKSTNKDTHGIIVSPTGTGKSCQIAMLIKEYQTITLIIENTRVLLDQMYDYLDSLIPGKVGIVGSGDFELNDVVIATYQSLSSILGIGKKQEPSNKAPILREWLDTVGLLVSDEVHESDTDSMTNICSIVKADKFIGFTATPYAWAHTSSRGVNQALEQNFGIKCYDSRETTDFIKIGLTVPLIIYRPLAPVIPEYANYVPVGRSEGEYREVFQKQIIDNEERIKFVAEQTRNLVKNGLSTYLYYNRIAYGERLLTELSDCNPVMLQGSTSRNIRKQIFKDLDSKKLLLAISDIGSYGLNLRSLNAIVIGSPMRDLRQLKGRSCRSSPGKSCGIVIDPIDMAPYLFHHSEKRKAQALKDGDTILG